MAKDLLLEIGTEEIPARFMKGIIGQLETNTKNKLQELRIAYDSVEALGTPRRMVLVVRGMAESQADMRSENKGPSVKIAFDADGKPTKAAQGFARGQGVAAEELAVKDGYVYALVHEEGKAVDTLLPDMLLGLINGLHFPKNMRWADLDQRFVRPIRWLIALHGSQVVPFTIAEVSTGNVTRGHRFLSSGEFAVNSVDEYLTVLRQQYVIVDQEERRRIIRQQVEALAVKLGGTATIDEELLEEVVYLVEYPTALHGEFEEKYLEIPPEAVITPMREHQRYFPVFAADGKLLPVFITVRNGDDKHLDVVRHGNERVLKARLADARFFYEEDKKVKLVDRLDKLKAVVFQEGLGTLHDKILRIGKLAATLATVLELPQELQPVISRSAMLSKADLVTGMVYEFTELQGTMGREYALLNGEDPQVAEAIFEHYLPRFAGDILPATPAGRMVSIADKLDNIVATFSRGLIPTGSQDPYALRRQALGIVNILIDGQYHLSLHEMLTATMELLSITDGDKQAKLLSDIQDFFRLRLKNVLSDEGVRYDLVDAVMAAGTDDVYAAWLRAKAVAAVNGSEGMNAAVKAFVRIGNLMKHAGSAGEMEAGLFTGSEELALYNAYQAACQAAGPLAAAHDYNGLLQVLINMAAPIDEFFSKVMVMAEDQAVRNNRLALLKGIAALASDVADMSRILA